VPLFLWIYGGMNGSESVNKFGLVDAETFNVQILVVDFWRRRIEFLDQHLNIERNESGQIINQGTSPLARRPAINVSSR